MRVCRDAQTPSRRSEAGLPTEPAGTAPTEGVVGVAEQQGPDRDTLPASLDEGALVLRGAFGAEGIATRKGDKDGPQPITKA